MVQIKLSGIVISNLIEDVTNKVMEKISARRIATYLNEIKQNKARSQEILGRWYREGDDKSMQIGKKPIGHGAVSDVYLTYNKEALKEMLDNNLMFKPDLTVSKTTRSGILNRPRSAVDPESNLYAKFEARNQASTDGSRKNPYASANPNEKVSGNSTGQELWDKSIPGMQTVFGIQKRIRSSGGVVPMFIDKNKIGHSPYIRNFSEAAGVHDTNNQIISQAVNEESLRPVYQPTWRDKIKNIFGQVKNFITGSKPEDNSANREAFDSLFDKPVNDPFRLYNKILGPLQKHVAPAYKNKNFNMDSWNFDSLPEKVQTEQEAKDAIFRFSQQNFHHDVLSKLNPGNGNTRAPFGNMNNYFGGEGQFFYVPDQVDEKTRLMERLLNRKGFYLGDLHGKNILHVPKEDNEHISGAGEFMINDYLANPMSTWHKKKFKASEIEIR